jgi:hypothetical protein
MAEIVAESGPSCEAHQSAPGAGGYAGPVKGPSPVGTATWNPLTERGLDYCVLLEGAEVVIDYAGAWARDRLDPALP